MQTSLLHSHDPLNDYRLIIDTPAVVHKKIAAIKTHFDIDYKGLVVAGGNPFIYLATFSQYEKAEQRLADALNTVAMGFMPFKMHLRNFGHIETNEIYIKVEEADMVQLLISNIKKVRSSMQDARFNELPRISLARMLQPWQFQKSWPQLSTKNFTATFLAAEMLLLKRMEGFRSWQILKHLAFQNQYITPMPPASEPVEKGHIRL